MEKQSVLKLFVLKTNPDLELLGTLPDVQIVDTVEEADIVAIGGGGDINPLLYCTSSSICDTRFSFSEARDLEDLQLYAKARKLRKPIFAIRRGAILVTALKGYGICQQPNIPSIACKVVYPDDTACLVETPKRIPLILDYRDNNVVHIGTSVVSKGMILRVNAGSVIRGESFANGIPHTFYWTKENIFCALDKFDSKTFKNVFFPYLCDMVENNLEAIYERACVDMPSHEDEYYDDEDEDEIFEDEDEDDVIPIPDQPLSVSSTNTFYSTDTPSPLPF